VDVSIMVHMIASSTTAPPRRVLLIPSEPRAGRNDASLRRYRLARVRLEGREPARGERSRRVAATATEG